MNLRVAPTPAEIQAIKDLSEAARADLAAQINASDPYTIFDAVEGKEGKQIICPKCGNGSGSSKTGIIPKIEGGKWLYHCFKCNNFEGDLISVIADANNLSTRGEKFFEVLAIGASILGLNVSDAPNLAKLILSDIEDSKARSDKIPERENRGLSDETIQAFKIGVDFAWTPPKNRLKGEKLYRSPRIIIPHLTNPALPDIPLTYCAALFQSERERLKRLGKDGAKYLYGGIRTPFGLNTLAPDAEYIFVTEGEFDALSVWQALSGKYPCIALGGKADNGTVAALSNFYPAKKPKIIFVADNDDAGLDCAKEMCNDFLGIGGFAATFTTFADISEPKLDANKILVAMGDAVLAEKLNSAITAKKDELDKMAADIQAGENLGVDASENEGESDSFLRDVPIKNLKLPKNYRLTRNGIYHNKKPISNTPAIISKVLEIGSDEFCYELAVYILGNWKRFVVDAESLLTTAKISSLARYGMLIKPKKTERESLANFFNELLSINARQADIIPTETFRTQPGWYNGKFIHPAEYSVYCGDFDYTEAFTPQGNSAEFKELLLKVLEASNETKLGVGLALAAPIIKPLGLENFQLHFGCRSGSGKTALLKIALAIFGNPKLLMTKFNSTAVAIERHAVALNDFPTGIDELQTINKFQRENYVDALIMNYESGREKGRGKKSGGMQEARIFHGVRLSTGEQTLTDEFSGEGAIKRVVEVTASKILPNDLAVEVHRKISRNYGHFGLNWIKYIETHVATLEEAYNALHAELSKAYPANFPLHVSAITAAQVTLEHFSRNFLGSPMKLDAASILCELPQRSEMQNGKRAIEIVADFVNANDKYFRVTTPPAEIEDGIGGDLNSVTNREPYTMYGAITASGDVLIYPQALRDALKNLPNFKAIVKDFSELGYLIEGNAKDKKRQHQKKLNIGEIINGRKKPKQIWGYCFKREVLFGDEGSDVTAADSTTDEYAETYSVPIDDGYSYDED